MQPVTILQYGIIMPIIFFFVREGSTHDRALKKQALDRHAGSGDRQVVPVLASGVKSRMNQQSIKSQNQSSSISIIYCNPVCWWQTVWGRAWWRPSPPPRPSLQRQNWRIHTYSTYYSPSRGTIHYHRSYVCMICLGLLISFDRLIDSSLREY